ncbi:MAG: hypothetical protein HRT66_03435 [Flavobacteriaceae bacterium]|nr:hypothetical protein [Flavobacteriaceae bacterium]
MNIKFNKIFYFLIVVLCLQSTACEEDDFCLDTTTPSLIIRFYDKDNPEQTKAVTELSINANDNIVIASLQKTDSIAVGLNTNLEFTEFYFISSEKTESIKISYTNDDFFVSKACGYKSIFNRISLENSFENTDNIWIDRIEIIESNITNQLQAHVKIFH